MIRRSICLTAVLGSLVVLAALPRGADAYHDSLLHGELRVWLPRLDAEVQSSRGTLVGDVITDTDLDLDDPVVPGGAVTLRPLRRHTLRVEGFDVAADGDSRVGRTFAFGGRTFTVNTQVLSELDARVVAADYGYDLVHAGPIALALTLGVRILDVEARLRAPLLGFEERASFQGVVPAVGAVLIVHPTPVPPFSSLALTLRLSGLSIGDRGEFFDIDGGAEWLPLPFLSVRVGYRFVHGRGEDGGDRAEFDLAGPYLGVTLTF